MSGPEGTPNGVDRLARIETYWKSDAVVTEPHGLVRDVLALIEIAKAARIVKAFDQAGGNDWWEAHAKLYAALARLDSGATEGDA